MTPAESLFRLLGLCTQRPGQARVVERMPTSMAAIPSGTDIVEGAVQHRLGPLVLAHLRAAKVAVSPSLTLQLYAQQAHHARTAAVRRRIMGDAVQALTTAGIPMLVLKGAALAHLVYDQPVHRPMRDVDLLVRRADATRAYDTLVDLGFTRTERTTAPSHHHLPPLMKGEAEVALVIELHHQLLPPTPFVAPIAYEQLSAAAQTFDWEGLPLRTLGREDMLWHVYMHAFAINALCPWTPLISIADLMHAVEAWVDQIDWDGLRRRYGRLARALPILDQLAPWSAHVAATLGVGRSRPASGLRALPSSLHWSGVTNPDVLWPPDWWFRMRYGVDRRTQWLRYRAVEHPLTLGLSAIGTASRRLFDRAGV